MVEKVQSVGTFGVDVYTVTDKNSTEENNEYSAFEEVRDEIKAILESRGYMVFGTSLTFHTQEDCTEEDYRRFEKRLQEGKKNADYLYNKANIETIRIDLS